MTTIVGLALLALGAVLLMWDEGIGRRLNLGSRGGTMLRLGGIAALIGGALALYDTGMLETFRDVE